MKNKKSKKKALKTKKTKINRRKRSRKTKKRSRKMRGKGSACSRISPEPHSEEVNTYINPREMEPWIKKANVNDDVCALCLEPLRSSGRKYVVYKLTCGHQFHAYCLNELCNARDADGNHISVDGMIPCPICRTLFDSKYCHDVDGFTNSDTELVPLPIMRMLESRDYTVDENYETSGK